MMVIALQLSDWRRQARQGLLTLPAELMAALPCENNEPFEPAFVPPAITTELRQPADALPLSDAIEASSGIGTLEICSDLVVRVPGDVPVDRVAAFGAGDASSGMIVAGQRLPILIPTRPVDFRCGPLGAGLDVQTELKLDPHSGVTVIFQSKHGVDIGRMMRPGASSFASVVGLRC
jgi:transposase-like protein